MHTGLMRDAYKGPATLIGSGKELDVDAELWTDKGRADTSSILDHGGRVFHSRGLKSWGGFATLTIGDSAFGIDQGVLRLPGGGEGQVILRLDGVCEDRARVEIQGSGPAPFPA